MAPGKIQMSTKWILFILTCLIYDMPGFSQWTQMDGPYGKTTCRGVFGRGDKVFAITNCGLHSSYGLSSRWELEYAEGMDVFVQKGDSLFFCGYNNGVMLVDLSIPDYEPILHGLNTVTITALKSDVSNLYAGIALGGFYRSIGFSAEWTAFNAGLPVDSMSLPHGDGKYYLRYVNVIETLGDFLICGTNKGVYRSEKEEIVWVPVNNGLPLSSVHLLENFGDTLFAAIANQVYVSEDLHSWKLFYFGVSNISSILKSEGSFFISTQSDGVFRSEDQGVNWESYNNGLSSLEIVSLQEIEDTIICGTASRGLNYFNGTSWIANNKGIVCSEVRSLAATPDVLFSNDVNGVYRSYDAESWQNISPDVDFEFFSSVASSNNTVFLSVEYNTASWPYDSPYILWTGDHGNNWEHLIQPVPFVRDDPYKIYAYEQNLYAYEDEMMFRSDNLGTSWANLTLPPEYCNSFNDFVIFKGGLYASACGPAQILRLNSSNHWILSNQGLPDIFDIDRLAIVDDAIFSFAPHVGVYVSTDLGITWSEASGGLDTRLDIRSFAFREKTLFIATEIGVYYTDDYGQNWSLLVDGLINRNISALTILNDTLYAGTNGNGIWKYDLKDITVPVSEHFYPDEELVVMPNPAFEWISILPATRDDLILEIQIVDILGRNIRFSVTDSKNQISVAEIPEGTYFVVVKSPGKRWVKKLIISR
jgi:hypothetical protein